jgi:hypothetical protein
MTEETRGERRERLRRRRKYAPVRHLAPSLRPVTAARIRKLKAKRKRR